MHQDTAPSSSSAASNSASLFNADEARFMKDSLLSADSFDPFSVGALGFKVPNVLPANLGGIGSAPRASTSANGSSMSWSDRDGMGNNHNQYSPSQNQASFASQLQAPSQSSNPNSIRGGYGRDKAWQMQQLEALQAEKQRYLHHQRQLSTSSDGGPSSMPDFNHTGMMGHSLDGLQPAMGYMPSNEAQSRPGEQQYDTHIPMAYPNSFSDSMPSYVAAQNTPMTTSAPLSARRASHDLSHLALNFPSSHQFPAASQEEEGSSKRQRRGKVDGGIEAIPVDEYNEEEGGRRRGRSPNLRPSWTQSTGMSDFQLNGGSMAVTSDSKPSKLNGSSGKSKPDFSASQGQQQQQQQQRGVMTIDMDAPYTSLPAPRPPPSLIDNKKVQDQSQYIPAHLSEAFVSAKLTRFQPHLNLLREEQLRRKERGLSANIRKGDKKIGSKQAEGSPDKGGDGGEGEKKKSGHVLLTDAEKKANHIASEQKRRANIRKGYELLCEMIPDLGEDGGDKGSGANGDEEDENDGDEMDEEGGDEDKKGRKGRSGETSMEGKTGPRSEAGESATTSCSTLWPGHCLFTILSELNSNSISRKHSSRFFISLVGLSII
jgi:hypothetical protein